MRLRADGQIDFSKYSDEELQQARRSLDRAEFPINDRHLCAELEKRVASVRESSHPIAHSTADNSSELVATAATSVGWNEPGRHLAAERARKGSAKIVLAAAAIGVLVTLGLVAFRYLFYQQLVSVRDATMMLAIFPTGFALVVYARHRFGRIVALTKERLVVVPLGSRHFRVIRFADIATCTLRRLSGSNGDYALLVLVRRNGRSESTELPLGEKEREVLDVLERNGLEVELADGAKESIAR